MEKSQCTNKEKRVFIYILFSPISRLQLCFQLRETFHFSLKQCTSSYSKCLDVQKMSEKKEVTLKILLGKLVKVCILNWLKQDLGKACIADFESDATL